MKTILVVEDDLDIRDSISDILSMHGYQVFIATDGKQGLSKALANPPDLIISDIMMPGLDGYQLLQKLKASAALKPIPVVLLSAKAQSSDAERGLALGAAHYILKPFKMDELMRVVRLYL